MSNDASIAQTHRPWTTRLGLGALLAAAALLVGALLLEAATRVVMDNNGMHFGVEMWKYARTLKRKSADPNIGHEHVASGAATLMGVPVTISSQGLRDRDYAIPRPEGVHRILVLGDSMTLGWGARIEDTYAKVLERRLNESSAAHGPQIEIVNTGVGNYNTNQEVAWFVRSGLDFQPNAILLAFYINDAEPTPVERQTWLAQHSYLYVFGSSGGIAVKRKLGLAPTFFEYYRDLYQDDRPGWQACQAAIRRLAAVCRERNIPLRLMLIPELHFPQGAYPFQREHALVVKLAEAENVPTLDLQHAFEGIPPRELWVSPGDAHPNAKAHAIIAAQLFGWRIDGVPWYAATPVDRSPSDSAPEREASQAAAASLIDSQGAQLP